MIVLAAVLGIAIGVTLGAIGAGGSILAVPVLVHVAGLPVPVATATSLVAVGSAAAVAAVGHRDRIEIPLSVSFIVVGGVGSLAGAWVGRQLSDDIVLIAFSGLVLVAAQRMLAGSRPEAPTLAAGRRVDSRVGEILGMIGAGLLVGVFTGLFGVGGGFVIVPVLTLILGRGVKEAIATSLVIIAGNSVIAVFTRGVGSVDWSAAAIFTIPMLVGSVVGARLASRLDPHRTRRIFGIVLIAVAVGNALSVLI